MSLWAAIFELLENDNLRARIYSTGAGAGGLVQVFSGTVTDAGGLGDDAYYSFLGPKGLGVGERKDGSYTGAVNCGRINANGSYTNAAENWSMSGKNGSTILSMEGTTRIGSFDQISADGSAPLSVQWKYSAELDCFVLCEKK